MGEAPEDEGARAVLGDALTAAGDARGALINLQLAIARAPREPADRDRRLRLMNALLDAHWDRWFGDLASILVRQGTELRRGMLEVIRVGRAERARGAWTEARGHRELKTVHTARPELVADADYAAIVAALPHLRTLEIDSPGMVLALDAIGARLPITRLEYKRGRPRHVPGVTARRMFELAARVAPDVTEIVLGAATLGDELPEIRAAVRTHFRIEALELEA